MASGGSGEDKSSAAKGALILRPNYRGSAGYGEKFRSLNVRNLGIGDYQDVISGVDFLIAKGIVDKDRVGAMGWSEGGYISAFITTYSDRFKAVTGHLLKISLWRARRRKSSLITLVRSSMVEV